MKARVDRDMCIGCGLCADLAPSVFHMNDDGIAEAISNELSGDLASGAEEARQQCPNEAISTEE